ncbi:MAG: NifB/NifX family molybdenum-iron cluster-binding protein [Chloroflexota bacterium]|nr:NifB/NifX family molybdenum-iron cluster-binding protein [Chloroflexota bacterium]
MNRPKIAIGMHGKGQIWNGHFGMAPLYYIYAPDGELLEKRVNPYGAGGGRHKHHDDPDLVVDLLPECGVFIARRMGQKSKLRLRQELGIQTVITTETKAPAAIEAYLVE